MLVAWFRILGFIYLALVYWLSINLTHHAPQCKSCGVSFMEGMMIRAEDERTTQFLKSRSNNAERLERIATAAMRAALNGNPLNEINVDYFEQVQVKNCVRVARALIAELDKEEG